MKKKKCSLIISSFINNKKKTFPVVIYECNLTYVVNKKKGSFYWDYLFPHTIITPAQGNHLLMSKYKSWKHGVFQLISS